MEIDSGLYFSVAPSGPPRSASHGVPVNRRPVPQMPPEEEQVRIIFYL